MNNKVYTALTKITMSFALAVCASVAQASTITLDPQDSTAILGDTFSVAVVGQDFTDGETGTLGGGFLIDWDPTILALDSYSLTFPGDLFFAQVPVQDDVAGYLNADVSSFLTGATTANFEIAVLNFSAVGLGVSALDLSVGTYPLGSDIVWADGGGFEPASQPVFVDGSATVSAVPVPAAVWLFGTGLLGLIGVARRRA